MSEWKGTKAKELETRFEKLCRDLTLGELMRESLAEGVPDLDFFLDSTQALDRPRDGRDVTVLPTLAAGCEGGQQRRAGREMTGKLLQKAHSIASPDEMHVDPETYDSRFVDAELRGNFVGAASENSSIQPFFPEKPFGELHERWIAFETVRAKFLPAEGDDLPPAAGTTDQERSATPEILRQRRSFPRVEPRAVVNFVRVTAVGSVAPLVHMIQLRASQEAEPDRTVQRVEGIRPALDPRQRLQEEADLGG